MGNIDVSYGPHLITRHQVLSKYVTALKQLRSKAERSYELRPFAFDSFVLFQYFQHSRNTLGELSLDTSEFVNFSPMTFLKIELLSHILDRRRQIFYWLIYILLAMLCIAIYRHEITSSAAEQRVRSMVYPGMRMWRRITLPLIERFPRLTELYDEACLMGNPFFQIDDINCSPCSHVSSVLDLTAAFENRDVDKSIQKNGVKYLFHKIIPKVYVPFVFKNINHDAIELQDVYHMYVINQDIFQRDAYRVHSTNREVTNLEELFAQFNQTLRKETHNLWRCNRMLPARLIRKLIARPSTLPNSLALERYMAIDTSQAQSYTLPSTECPNVYIQQSLGTRFIILRPTSECRSRCRTLSIRLPQSHVYMRAYSSTIKSILELIPGKKRFGLYRFLPLFFCLGAALEYSMVNWTVGETNFYRTFKKRQAKNYVEEKFHHTISGDTS